MEEQRRLGAFAEHGEEGDGCERTGGSSAQRVCGAGVDHALPRTRILPQEKPAAHVKHQGRGHEHHDRFHEIVVRAVEPQLENDRGDDARGDGGERSGPQRAQIVEAALAERGGERRDDQHRLQPFTQEDRARLQRDGKSVHRESPCG